MRYSIRYIICILIITLVQDSFGQTTRDSTDIPKFSELDIPEYDYIVSTNPFLTFWGCVPFSGEYRIMNEIRTGPRTSVNIGGAYLSKGLFLMMVEGINNSSIYGTTYALRGYRAQVMYKFYVSSWDVPPEGLYIGPYFSLAEAKFSYQQTKILKDYYFIRQINYNMIMGYQFKMWDRFTTDMFFGFGYKENSWTEHETTSNFQAIGDDELPPLYNNHFKFILGLNFGFIVN